MLSNALGGSESDPGGLDPLPEAILRALEQRSAAATLAQHLTRRTVGSVIGRGFAYPPALEIALKLKETSYTRAEPFSAADFLHGPVALVEHDYSALLVDVGGRSSQAATDIAAAVRTRGGQPVLLRAAQNAPPTDMPHVSVSVHVAEPYAPIVVLALGQLLALELAAALGLDAARPRGLRKVTSTR
jgi:glucosamine--fructose-6-phosphate aminotransferase (isomerizing)